MQLTSPLGCASMYPVRSTATPFELNPSWTKLMPSKLKSNITMTVSSINISSGRRWCFQRKFLAVNGTSLRRCGYCIWKINNSTRVCAYVSDSILCGRPAHWTPTLRYSGADTFNGNILHSARWNHTVNLEGKKWLSLEMGVSSKTNSPSASFGSLGISWDALYRVLGTAAQNCSFDSAARSTTYSNCSN